MKDVHGELQYNGRTYRLVFNLNVMEAVQEEYGSVDAWAEITDAKRAKRDDKGNVILDDEGEVIYEKAEPDAKAVIFGFTQMINEGLEIEAEENGTFPEMLTAKQVGRMISAIGLERATGKINKTVVDSIKSEEKNA